MERLLINNGRYQGERIDVREVLRQLEVTARKHGWKTYPINMGGQFQLPAFGRGPTECPQIYLSSGIHGDEPAGPLAMLRLLEMAWPEQVGLWLAPCLNPGGFELNSRENEVGIDLNRDYRSPKTDLVRAHVEWLNARPRFDLTLLLHEDWESHGFYLYELNPKKLPSLARVMLEAAKEFCPLDLSPVIEGRAAQNGVVSASPDLFTRPDWPEAFYLIHHKTDLSYTLEAPSDFRIEVRVQALVAAVQAAVHEWPARARQS